MKRRDQKLRDAGIKPRPLLGQILLEGEEMDKTGAGTPTEVTVAPPAEKTYLGDGLYASFDGWQIALTAENGIEVTNVVYLEPSVYRALLAFVDKLTDAQQQLPKPRRRSD